MTNVTQWFVTVGVPGGEYACQAENREAAQHIIVPHLQAADCAYIAQKEEPLMFSDRIFLRPAPPELAGWLNAKYGEWQLVSEATCYSMRVHGGWLFTVVNDLAGVDFGALLRGEGQKKDEKAAGCIFVPVAMAGGITVLSA
jgi:hypothetical protein